MKICDLLSNVDIELLKGDSNCEINFFERNSKEIKKGDCFVAIVGEKFDGNDFIISAIENGAKSIICSRKLTDDENKIVDQNDVNVLLAKDTVKAIQDIARYKRTLIDVPVVAITGSVGKTSTKDTISSVLSSKFRVLKTEGNLNNEIGVPFTILRYTDEDVIVVEMGMNGFGQISVLTNIAKPTIVVITNIGTAHIGILGSRDNILKAKMEILEGLQSNVVIINNDNDLLHNWFFENSKKYNVITYGISEKSKYVAEKIDSYEEYSEFDIDGERYRINVGGEHFVLNSLCAYSVGKFFNLTNEEIRDGLYNLKLTEKRMQKIDSVCGAIIINDAYNAYEISIRQYKQMTNPTEEFVLQRLKTVDDIVDARAVTEDHDPNRKLHKPGGYTATVYFESKTVDQTKFSYLDKNDLIEKGTDAGGAVEVYETEELAIKRRDYLAAYDGSILSNGSHTVVGTCLIRTSDKLSASKQKELENKVIEALTKLD